MIPKPHLSDYPESDKLLFEQLSRNMPPERAVEFYRVLTRLRQMKKDDDLVTLVEGFALCAGLIRDVPAQLISERAILLQQLDQRIGRCESLLVESNGALQNKFSRLDNRLSDSKVNYDRGISDFRRHVDARVQLAENRHKALAAEMVTIAKRVHEATNALSDYLDSLRSSSWSRFRLHLGLFCMGFACAAILLRIHF
jgi:hypothetical protein